MDGIKIKCISNSDMGWESNSLLDFKSIFSTNTGEIMLETKTAFFKSMKFEIKQSQDKKRIYYNLYGSLAKYYNDGKNNAFDFNYLNLQEVVYELRDKFNIDLDLSRVIKFEIGCNILTSIPANDIIDGFRAHKGRMFSFCSDQKFYGLSIKKQNHEVKIYNKGLQVGNMLNNYLRIELKANNSKELIKFGIVSLQDLLEKEKLFSMYSSINQFWKDVIFYNNEIDLNRLTERENQTFMHCLDKNYWGNLTRSKRNRSKNEFNDIKKRHCTTNLLQEITEKFNSKMSDLIEMKCA